MICNFFYTWLGFRELNSITNLVRPILGKTWRLHWQTGLITLLWCSLKVNKNHTGRQRYIYEQLWWTLLPSSLVAKKDGGSVHQNCKQMYCLLSVFYFWHAGPVSKGGRLWPSTGSRTKMTEMSTKAMYSSAHYAPKFTILLLLDC